MCWLPFFTWYLTVTICGDTYCPCPDIVVSILFWIGYFNSTLNPFIYVMTNRDFKDAFTDILRRIFCCCCSSSTSNKACCCQGCPGVSCYCCCAGCSEPSNAGPDLVGNSNLDYVWIFMTRKRYMLLIHTSHSQIKRELIVFFNHINFKEPNIQASVATPGSYSSDPVVQTQFRRISCLGCLGSWPYWLGGVVWRTQNRLNWPGWAVNKKL